MQEDEDGLDEFEDRVAAKRRVGHDMASQLLGTQLSQAEIMRRLHSSPRWRTLDVMDSERGSMTGPRRGFTVRMVRHSDAATAHLHFVNVIDELYRLIRWDAHDALYPRHGSTRC